MILDKILENKRQELEVSKKYASLKFLNDKIARSKPLRDFTGAISTKGGPEAIRIIAEVKKASPSKGVIKADYYPFEIARMYQLNGAVAVSVLTEEKFFKGHIDHLTSIKINLKLPVLRKDFIFDEYQVIESRAAGADAILLIAAIVEQDGLKRLIDLTYSLGMAALVEVHDEDDLKKAAKAGARIIGINNRDLKTFEVDTKTTERLAPLAPKEAVIVSESGISTHQDIVRLKGAGASAFLIGEALMREENIGAKLKELILGD
ncbi:MAG: indole-3-glycerol phosphate synthase TrpC [Deltaproteobacteria bacterium]|nr:indole-3-glycerol phosphate synthase TrpC [Deltaproteobacteria bacterium]